MPKPTNWKLLESMNTSTAIWLSIITAVVIYQAANVSSLRQSCRECDQIAVDGYQADDQRIMRLLGLARGDHQYHLCKVCGLAVWNDVPESQLGENGICKECRDKKLKAVQDILDEDPSA